jgi:hypothetical protein
MLPDPKHPNNNLIRQGHVILNEGGYYRTRMTRMRRMGADQIGEQPPYPRAIL